MVDLDNNIRTSWEVFFTWLDVVKGFFLSMERIMQSSITAVFHGHLGLFVLPSSFLSPQNVADC